MPAPRSPLEMARKHTLATAALDGDVVDSTAYPSEMGKIVEQGNDEVRGHLVEVKSLRPA